MLKVDEKQLKDYVLGALPEVEQTAVEQALLADRDQFDAACALENELVDRYVRHQMPAAERARFERHYLASPLHRERIAIAELFLQEIDAESSDAPSIATTQPGWRAWWTAWRGPQLIFGGALAAALLLAGGALWHWSERADLQQQLAQSQYAAQLAQQREQAMAAQKQALENELAQARARNQQLDSAVARLRQPAAVTAPVLSFLLMAGATRNQNDAPPVVPFTKRKIQLLLPLDGAAYACYRAALQTVEGRPLFSQDVSPTADRAFAPLALPVGQPPRGDYVAILSGCTPRGAWEEIDRYFFRIQ